MKKLLVFIIMPFVAVFFHCNAQEHSLRVADVYVTNQSGNISSQYITGQVSYDPETQTLTMENASITCPDPSGYNVVGPDIESTNMDLTLKLIGENSIQGLEPISNFIGTIHVEGPGSLLLWRQNGSHGFYGFGCTNISDFFITDGANIHIRSVGVGISTEELELSNISGILPTLHVDSSTLLIEATKCIDEIKGFELVGCHIETPQNAYYNNDSLSLLTEDGNRVRNFLSIVPNTVGISDYEACPYRIWGSFDGIHFKDVQPGEAVDVFNPLGQCIYHSQIQSSRTFVPLHQGMYIVRVGKYSKKVLVN